MNKKHLNLSFLLFLASSSIFSGNLNFKKAFNLDEKFEEHAELLRRLDCGANIFGDGFRAPKTTIWQRVKNLNPFCKRKIKNISQEDALKRFQEDCLSKLTVERRRANLQPVRRSLTYLGVTLMMHSIMSKVFGSGDMASGFANMRLAYSISGGIKDLVESGYELLFPKDDPLDELAKEFIESMPYIPRKFWPSIVNKFIIAKGNQFEYTNATNFIKFALGLKIYKDSPKVEISNIDEVIKELNLRIDNFFKSYNNVNLYELSKIKMSIAKFINNLFDSKVEMPRYQYLVGPGGIGKTHFIKELSSWINELIPNAVNFSDVVINSAEELEGSANKPGLFLNALRDQLASNKRGSIVFIDEFKCNSLVEPAKRTFNGNMSQVSTAYFGNEIGAKGIKLEIPPMLIFVASNDRISDKALESRFNIINFCTPNKASLSKYAENIARNSKIVNATEDDIQKLKQKVQAGNYSNFREIEELVEPFIHDLQNNPKPPTKTNQLDFDVSDEVISLRSESAGTLDQ